MSEDKFSICPYCQCVDICVCDGSESAVEPLVRCFRDGVDDLVFWSFRYFLGRQTIATCQFAEDLARAWPLLRERTRSLIRSELEKEFRLDDEARAAGEQWKPLGLDCDREAWQKVRDVYS